MCIRIDPRVPALVTAVHDGGPNEGGVRLHASGRLVRVSVYVCICTDVCRGAVGGLGLPRQCHGLLPLTSSVTGI